MRTAIPICIAINAIIFTPVVAKRSISTSGRSVGVGELAAFEMADLASGFDWGRWENVL